MENFKHGIKVISVHNPGANIQETCKQTNFQQVVSKLYLLIGTHVFVVPNIGTCNALLAKY